ncbi:MAG: ATP-binding cassette domain-containing protein [Defluviitaleaceae bacterium]|nr:ATP-binding cassette domain-containing protein [Defluviitaleaceae bacterium]
MALIEISNITKDYGDGRGNFGVNLSIEKGETIGFVGMNGAGKTTLIRQMMGFLRPSSGSIKINGLDAWKDSHEIKKMVGYIPGEIAFPDAPSGSVFLQRQAELLGLKDMSYAEYITKKLQLDPTANLKRMSKGMKQKTAIVAAFMADAEILIMDEPTTGLDPLMRAEFVEIIHAERAKGKTIFMSNHMFEEMEETCDKVALIKDGKMIAVKPTSEIKHNPNKVYEVEYDGKKETYEVHDSKINEFFQKLKNYNVTSISEVKYSLEQYFKSLY